MPVAAPAGGSALRPTVCSNSSSDYKQVGGNGGCGAKATMRRVSSCISVSGVLAGGSSCDTFMPQQQDRQQGGGSTPALKPYTFLPFLVRGPRVTGTTLPVCFRAYSCHGMAAVPAAAARDSAAAKVYGRCGALSLPTIRVKTTDFNSGRISAGRRQSSADHGTMDLERISDSLQVTAAGSRSLGQARAGLRRAAKSRRHCSPEEESH